MRKFRHFECQILTEKVEIFSGLVFLVTSQNELKGAESGAFFKSFIQLKVSLVHHTRFQEQLLAPHLAKQSARLLPSYPGAQPHVKEL